MSKRFGFTFAVIALLAVGAWGQQIQDPAALTPTLTTPTTDFQNPYEYTPPQIQFVPNSPWTANVKADSGSTSNPTDGALCVSGQRKVVVQWNHYISSSFVWRSAVTTNAGLTWTPSTILSTGTQFDNVLGSNKKDSTICLVMKSVSSGYNWYLKRSTDSGVTWGDTIHVPQAATGTTADHPIMAVKPPYVLVTYYAGQEGIARSTNWGVTWNPSQVFLSTATAQGGCPAFDPRPTSTMAYATWGQPAGWTCTSYWMNRSTDLGATWGTAWQIRAADTAAFARSRPNHNFPSTVVDRNGKIYCAVQNKLTGTGWDCMVITSTNQGTTWSAPVQVNDTTGGGAQVLNAHSMIPWITIDRYNQPHVFWYDNRAYHPTLSFDVFYSYSMNGGVTWARNERINDVSPATTGSAYLNMCGDYMQIDTDSSNVYVEWTDHRNGHTSNSYIATASRPVPFSGVEEKPTVSPWVNHKSYLAPSRPNPVMNGTELAFELEKPGPASLRVYDLSGKLVRTVVDGSLAAGSHTARWDAKDESGKPVASGVYFYRLESSGLTATQKLVVAR